MSHTVAGQTIELVLPASAAVRQDILSCISELQDPQIASRVLAASLALCSPTLLRKGAPAYDGRLLKYGGAVIDFLRSKGATNAEISTVGSAALQLVCDDFVAEVEATKAAAGNSEAPEGASSGNSGRSSSDSGSSRASEA